MWICAATARRLGWRTLGPRSVHSSAMQERRRSVEIPHLPWMFGSVYSFLVGEIIAAKVHHFVPYRNEVARELFLGIATCIDFGDRPELRVRAEHQIDACSSPLEFAGRAIASLIGACGAV